MRAIDQLVNFYHNLQLHRVIRWKVRIYGGLSKISFEGTGNWGFNRHGFGCGFMLANYHVIQLIFNWIWMNGPGSRVNRTGQTLHTDLLTPSIISLADNGPGKLR